MRLMQRDGTVLVHAVERPPVLMNNSIEGNSGAGIKLVHLVVSSNMVIQNTST